ncbi:MAG: zinc metallopeptidase [Gemmatimonadota bacterium]|nr:zinc metallopeptidase [Gemmatimonadota bacterium]MDH5198876.1 zinc metallopeptidase [Gemmatimonadota bacterium]
MRWTRRTGPSDVEDRRGVGARPGLRVGLGGMVVLLLLSVVFKQDFFSLLGGGGAMLPSDAAAPVVADPEEERLAEFVEFVVGDAQDTWTALLGQDYRRARLVLFRGAVQSGCGYAQAAMGPFYCPADEKVYIDLGFYDELRTRFGAPGDFAQAYVIAHEVGHHVQHLLGIESAMRRESQQRPDRANSLSVALELQADCFAGVWGYSTAQRDMLVSGDVEEGLQAAAAVGDDRIQQRATGEVHPESFTHGSAADRAAWFRRGLEAGQLNACDTFARAR